MAGLCGGGNEPPSSLKAISKSQNVDEIGDSEMIFGEMKPRIRHRLPDIHLAVGENLGKNPNSSLKSHKAVVCPRLMPYHVTGITALASKGKRKSKLEYASTVWNSITSTDLAKLVNMMKDRWSGEKFSPAPGSKPGFSALRADALSTKPHRIPVPLPD
ncbi:hypothetical protein ANN_11881 [Periplaneta americana]|uniref:Uncharacterized protein n=1 Tax=Periplaneta americana TaxID=6978 RepID=A0ABQ8T6A1_PERAM|nr:hypothetical protein ANN_11881 [Periplaneta americana]